MNYLFSEANIFDVERNAQARVKQSIQELGSNYILNASEEDLVRALVNDHRWNVPVINKEEIHIADYGETQVDVSGDPRRFILDRDRPVYIPGTHATVAIPFDGDPMFFKIRPQTYSLNPPQGDIVRSEIRLTYTRTDHDANALKREYTSTLDQIEQHLERLRSSAASFNQQLEPMIREQVAAKKRKLLADAGMVESLGLPIRKRAGAPTTYAIPVAKRKPQIARPPATTVPFKPEPALPTEEYEAILSIIRNMVTVMEQSPKAFEQMGEEDLRTHFLVQLNAQYEGQATGETFNFQGKTDILIRVDGKNVFIAECKFWKGEKQLLETIDQLLSYLSWRDTKAAILVFSRNANFSDVLAKIATAVPKHPCFKRDLGKSGETTFRYVFHQPNDANREILLSVLAFDIPAPAKAATSPSS